MTSCRLPKPDWQLISHSIQVVNNNASTHNSIFKFLNIPLFYLPYVAHNLDETGRQSGVLIPVFANSGVKGLVLGEQVYWVINRSMDLTLGAEYWSKRGFAPNGDFRYKGRGPYGLDALTVRWNALLDRGVEETLAGATTPTRIDQGGADIVAFGRKDFTVNTRIAGNVEYLSSYIYRLAFDENLAQATSSEAQSNVALTHNHRGFIPSVSLDRARASPASPPKTANPSSASPVRILHLPSVHFDVVDRPFPGISRKLPPLYWSLGSSIGDLDRAEPHFHARDVGRMDIYPHLEWPLHLGDWQIRPEFALRTTQYSGSQTPDLAGTNFGGVPFVRHSLSRRDIEASSTFVPRFSNAISPSPAGTVSSATLSSRKSSTATLPASTTPATPCISTPPTSRPTPTKPASPSPSASTCAPSTPSPAKKAPKSPVRKESSPDKPEARRSANPPQPAPPSPR